MSNPGPASTVTTNTQSVLTTQGLRLLAVLRGLSVNTTGDTAFQPLLPGNFVPTTVVTVNANVTMATATVGIYTAPNQGGTAILTTAALTGQTTSTFAYVRAATATSTNIALGAGAYLYANVGVAVATGTVDLLLYGYDVSA